MLPVRGGGWARSLRLVRGRLTKAAAEKGHTLPMPDTWDDEDGDHQGWQWPTVRITDVDE